MPTWVTGICNRPVMSPRARHRRAAGFTLLELLTVILIIGIIVSFAGLSVGVHGSRVVQDEAERLQGLIRIAGEEAVLQGRELALEFDRHAYRFLMLAPDGQWLPPEQEKMLRERPLPETLRMDLLVEGVRANYEDPEKLPRVLMLSSGELTPFELNLSMEDEEESYRLVGQINGKLTLSRVQDDDDF